MPSVTSAYLAGGFRAAFLTMGLIIDMGSAHPARTPRDATSHIILICEKRHGAFFTGPMEIRDFRPAYRNVGRF